jgi:hypothetical protein
MVSIPGGAVGTDGADEDDADAAPAAPGHGVPIKAEVKIALGTISNK